MTDQYWGGRALFREYSFEKEIIVAGGHLKSVEVNVSLLHCLEAIMNDNELRSLM